MTKEQATDADCIRRSDIGLTDFEIVMCNGDYKEALKMLLDKIEKAPSVIPQPCADMVSRDAMWDVLQRLYGTEGELVEELMSLPPVLPMPKIGRWIEHFDESGKWYECDQCHTDWGGSVNYCPNCGSKM